MVSKTMNSETHHRKHKRLMEVSISIEAIAHVRQAIPEHGKSKQAQILEFGCGDGFQIPALQKLGNVIASDVYRGELDEIEDAEFIQCSIADTPFATETFDIVYSNHVIEHIEDIEHAFDELVRIGKPDCIYAFSVPTNIWLLLSLPAQYLGKVKSLAKAVQRRFGGGGEQHAPGARASNGSLAASAGTPRWQTFASMLAPKGHGVIENYIACYNQFKVSEWSKLFAGHGFSILEVRPLLLYAPSECPVIPTGKSRFGLSSSVLFLMRKSASANS
jgi:SAM-dependent methyltransferase